MAAIVAANVSYSFDLKNASKLGRAGKLLRGTISFGDGSLTYPSGGVPLTKGKLGCPQVIKSVKILEDNASGYVYQFDVSTSKLRMFQLPLLEIDDTVDINAQPLVELGTSEVPQVVLEVEVIGW